MTRRPRLARLALCTLGGVLTFQAFPEWDLFPLAWLCLLPTLVAIEGQRPRQAFLWGWLHGFVTNLGGFYWVVHLLVTFGQMPWPVAAFLFALLAAYQGLVFGVWAGVFRALEDSAPLPRSVVRVAVFVAAEFTIPFVFPWYLANSQWNFPWASQICDLFGVLGLSALLVATSVLLWEAACRPELRRRALGILAALIALDLGYGALRISQVETEVDKAPKVRIALIEGDIGIAQKANPEHVANNLAIHQRLSSMAASAGAELIVWPESAFNATWFPTSVTRVTPSRSPLADDPHWNRLQMPDDGHLVLTDGFPALNDAAADAQAGVEGWDKVTPLRGFSAPLLLGAITWEPEPDPPAPGRRWKRRIMNSALLLDADGTVDGRLYFKNYLLVFGEYIPFGRQLPWLYDMVPAASAFTPGTEVEVFELGALRAGVMICYEGILPRWTRRLAGRKDPNVFVNITNDAWFGKKGEPWLHLVLTTFRAIENRRSFVRSTNTGISAFVDPVGRITARTSVSYPEILMSDVALMEGGTVYRAVGDVLGWLGLAVVAGLAWVARRRRRR